MFLLAHIVYEKALYLSVSPLYTHLDYNQVSLAIWNYKRDIRFLKPFGFFDYNKLQKEAFCAISDSGTISEESAILDFPAVTIRQSIERPEALDAGSIILTGLDVDILLSAVELAEKETELFSNREIPEEYKVENTSLRVVKFILGTAKLANKWRNMDNFSRYEW